MDSILSTEVIEGTYCPENRQLIEDIEMHPERYKTIFSSSANLKILNYLELCNRMDTTPYITDYDLIHYIDGDRVKNGRYALNDQQFQEVVAAERLDELALDPEARDLYLGGNAARIFGV